ncbi:nuclease-related domain-containing protein [Streptomyces sp. L-9-10]|uniref:nuclease-related domain-containing protein n=1 Tax=Streptomyces sp. L-9-10 TaxID=1478131 RepID=UPI00101C82D2|nr:nuclease-related domain-containing protein [Streptomyces sp. L-9-10]
MSRLRVTPTRGQGRDRLYVSLRDGTTVAWYDKDTGRVSVLSGAGRDEVLSALAPYLTGEVTVGPPRVPTPADLDRLSLHPDDDLAPNRPGEALHAELSELDAPRAAGAAGSSRSSGSSGSSGASGASSSPSSPSSPLWRRWHQDPRQAELLAQEAVGDRLDGLEAAGWRVLHSIPLPGAARIDHLAIGPAGVLAVRTLPARKRRVGVEDPLVRVGRAAPAPHLRWARRAAERASRALAADVRPVLAVVEPGRLDALPAPGDVRILRDTEIPALASLGGVLKPADIESLYATARDRHSWLRV